MASLFPFPLENFFSTILWDQNKSDFTGKKTVQGGAVSGTHLQGNNFASVASPINLSYLKGNSLLWDKLQRFQKSYTKFEL